MPSGQSELRTVQKDCEMFPQLGNMYSPMMAMHIYFLYYTFLISRHFEFYYHYQTSLEHTFKRCRVKNGDRYQKKEMI
jgi:hypothetical protein